MNVLPLFFLALLAGMLLPVQVGFNNPLKQAFGSSLLPAFITFSTGSLFLLLYGGLLRIPAPAGAVMGRIPWWNWVGGGLCGAFFITLIILLGSRLGASVLFALVVGGEMTMSVVLDHFGWLGFQVHALSPGRLLGTAFLVAGVILIHRF
jgi:transporter family-2 protein